MATQQSLPVSAPHTSSEVATSRPRVQPSAYANRAAHNDHQQSTDLEPRVAVCLVGYVRTFVEPYVAQIVTKAARRYASENSIFAVIANDENDSVKGQLGALSIERVAHARGILQPRRWMQVGSSHPSQLAKLRLCDTWIEEIERDPQSQEYYEWVVAMRPDVVLFPPGRDWYSSLKKGAIHLSRNSGDLLQFLPRRFLPLISLASSSPNAVFNASKGLEKLSVQGLAKATGFGVETFDCSCTVVRCDSAAKLVSWFGLGRLSPVGGWGRWETLPSKAWHFLSNTSNSVQIIYHPETGIGIDLTSVGRWEQEMRHHVCRASPGRCTDWVPIASAPNASQQRRAMLAGLTCIKDSRSGGWTSVCCVPRESIRADRSLVFGHGRKPPGLPECDFQWHMSSQSPPCAQLLTAYDIKGSCVVPELPVRLFVR